MATRKSASIFYVYAFFAAIAALYHVNRYFFTPVTESASRHLFFIAISTVCVFGLIKRPRWFLYFFGMLMAQQLYSHGTHLRQQWASLHAINYIDLAVVVLVPVIFVSLLRHRHATP